MVGTFLTFIMLDSSFLLKNLSTLPHHSQNDLGLCKRNLENSTKLEKQ